MYCTNVVNLHKLLYFLAIMKVPIAFLATTDNCFCRKFLIDRLKWAYAKWLEAIEASTEGHTGISIFLKTIFFFIDDCSSISSPVIIVLAIATGVFCFGFFIALFAIFKQKRYAEFFTTCLGVFNPPKNFVKYPSFHIHEIQNASLKMLYYFLIAKQLKQTLVNSK